VSNDQTTLRGLLTTQLRDTDLNTSADVWSRTEKNDLLTYALARLYPRLSRELDPESTTITLVANDYFYSLPTGVMAVSSVDWVDTDSNEMGPIGLGSWEVVGSPILGTAKLHVSPVIANQGGTLRLNGYGRFDLTTNYIPDDYVPLVLALARAEAYRRLAGLRTRFKAWQAANQGQNVTVNELLLLVNEADAEANRLLSQMRVWKKPVPGRRG